MSVSLSLSSLRTSLYADSLPDFIRGAWEYYPYSQGRKLEWGRHLDVLCDLLMSISAGELPRKWDINIPPGCGKSSIINVFWPCWEWIKRPQYRYISVAYAPDNTIRDNTCSRAIVQSDWYRESFWIKSARESAGWDSLDVRLARGTNALEKFMNSAGGYRIASSVGGAITGEHPNRIILDDLLKAQEARSKKAREKVHGFLDFTLPTRQRLNPVVLNVGQRLHKDDPSGHLMGKGGWERLVLPMRFEPARADPTDPDKVRIITPDKHDWRTVEGELLFPGVFNEKKVRELEIELGPYGSAAQLQQHPIPLAGGLFKRKYFQQFVDANQVPYRVRRVRGWDTATGKAKDHTGSVKIAMTIDPKASPRFYIEDAFRDEDERLTDLGVDMMMHQLAELDGRACAIREEREPGASGDAVVQSRKRSFAGWDYMWTVAMVDKVTKSSAFRAECEAGNVAIVRGPWNARYIDLMCDFVGDDEDEDEWVDASAIAYNELTLGISGIRAGVMW